MGENVNIISFGVELFDSGKDGGIAVVSGDNGNDMDPLKVKHGKPSKGEGSLRLITESVMRCSSSISPPSTTFIHILDDEEQDVPIEGVPAGTSQAGENTYLPSDLGSPKHISALMFDDLAN
ncbi:hypothetical protein WN944_010272 [Citrus x changshan-huyou]|uniref:Uncharacterized protein n=1 Tax=Citrus x changshan-huyou TaxID=2935761 RepID=A0AAP0MRC2_9ROSI